MVTFGTKSAPPPSCMNVISSAVIFRWSKGVAAPNHQSKPEQERLMTPQNQKVAGQPRLGVPAKTPANWNITIVPNWEPEINELLILRSARFEKTNFGPVEILESVPFEATETS